MAHGEEPVDFPVHFLDLRNLEILSRLDAVLRSEWRPPRGAEVLWSGIIKTKTPALFKSFETKQARVFYSRRKRPPRSRMNCSFRC